MQVKHPNQYLLQNFQDNRNMSQCVPSWDLDGDNHRLSNVDSHSNTTPPLITTLDYEVAELTWTNGQLAMNSLGQPRVLMKPFTATPKWNVNPLATGGTLESIVHQATTSLHTDGKVVPWFENHRAAAVAAEAKGGDMSTVLSIDALVPSTNQPQCVADSSTHVGSCSRGAATPNKKGVGLARNRGRVARVERALRVPSIGTQDWSSRDLSASVSETFEQNDSRRMTTVDTFDRDYALGFTSTSAGSPENSSSGVPCKTSTGDEHDSVCHSRRQRQIGNEDENKKGNRKSSVSTKRSRAAAIHNQSERKRRDKINQRMKTLQKMVPNSSKIDKASMLDEVIEYLKQLQAQVTMMSRMNMTPAMMLPLAMQQQVQMSMMAPMMSMGMGMGMGMGMDMNTMAAARHTMSGIPPVLHPNSFMPGLPSWDAPGSDRVPAVTMPDPLSTFVACQSQPMTMDAYSKMAALYQQMNQPHG